MADSVRRIRRDYQAVRNSGTRKGHQIAYFVIHTAEAPLPETGAEAVGRYFESKNARGSTQYGVDVDSTQQYTSDLTVAWGAPPLNTSGLHVECAGKASFTRTEWLRSYAPMFERVGYLVAVKCRKYGIPMRVLTATQLKRIGQNPTKGKGGITTHNAVSDAWKQSDHWDPGKGFPMDIVMAFVEHYSQGWVKAKASKPVLHFGLKGKWVTRLQNDLKAHGHYTGKVDGIFGVKVEAAVKALQKQHKLKPNGIVTAAVWKVLAS